jgi:intracellular sulfur oxidation DsrE/DsrF family protein
MLSQKEVTMKHFHKKMLQNFFAVLLMVFVVALQTSSAFAEGYENALKDVKGVKMLFNVSLGDPTFNNIVFWAVRDAYQNEAVKSLPEKPLVAVVFHGPVVKLLSTDRTGFNEKDIAEIDKFQATLREMKHDGVILEVCNYALKVLGVDPETVIPEIDKVGNGFISLAGYEAQGYAVITSP